MKLCRLLFSLAFLVSAHSRAGETIAHQESQPNGVKSATAIYVSKAEIKVKTKMDQTKARVKLKTKGIKSTTKDKIRRKLFVPQATTNYDQAVVKLVNIHYIFDMKYMVPCVFEHWTIVTEVRRENDRG